MLTFTIPRRSRSCEACQEKFDPGAEYASALTDGDKEGLVRHDFCKRCWNDERLEEHKGFWKAVVPEKKSITKDPEGHYLEVLELLREEIENDTQESRGYAFILALYLTRKKQLILRQEIDLDGQQAFLYEVLSTEEMLCVKNVTLTLEEMQTIQQSLTERFQS